MQQCKSAFQQMNEFYGCCFHNTAINTIVSFSNALWAQCGADNPGLCAGGITESAVNAPRGDEEGSALASFLTSSTLLLVFFALSLAIRYCVDSVFNENSFVLE